MRFCPKCGSILIPKKVNKKVLLVCGCGYKSKERTEVMIKEDIAKREKKVEVVEELETHPIVDAVCPRCGNGKAYFWTLQTRAADEPETQFYKCTKCGHVWREYR